MVKIIRLASIVCSFCITLSCTAAPVLPTTTLSNNMAIPPSIENLLLLSPKNFEKATGLHLSFKEKIGYRILQWKLQKQLRLADKADGDISKAEKHSKNALFCGIVTWGALLLGLAVPVFGLFSIPFAIAAVIFGAVSLNKTSNNTRSIVGIILGGLYLILFALALLVFISGVK